MTAKQSIPSRHLFHAPLSKSKMNIRSINEAFKIFRKISIKVSCADTDITMNGTAFQQFQYDPFVLGYDMIKMDKQ